MIRTKRFTMIFGLASLASATALPTSAGALPVTLLERSSSIEGNAVANEIGESNPWVSDARSSTAFDLFDEEVTASTTAQWGTTATAEAAQHSSIILGGSELRISATLEAATHTFANDCVLPACPSSGADATSSFSLRFALSDSLLDHSLTYWIVAQSFGILPASGFVEVALIDEARSVEYAGTFPVELAAGGNYRGTLFTGDLNPGTYTLEAMAYGTSSATKFYSTATDVYAEILFVPEPNTAFLVAVGLCVLLGYRALRERRMSRVATRG